jgi:uroporphyrinogen-III decarboxylase
MYRQSMSSRQRMLAALTCQEVDHPPCSFMLYKGLLSQSRDYLDFIQRQLDLGLDAFVQLPPRPPVVTSDAYNLHGLPVSFSPGVQVREWMVANPDEKWPVLYKEYQTPAGALRAEVYQDAEWPYGNHIPFLDDYIETRSRKFIVTTKEDLSALRYLLIPPTATEITQYREEVIPVLEFARKHDLLVAGGWGVGADLIGWVYGLQRMMYTAYDDPEFVEELLALICSWNHSRMEVVLDSGIDLYIKRAWYENTDFWSTKNWKKFIFPILKSDVDLAHRYGAKFGYLITANCMPLIEMIVEAGVDVIIGVDPAKWDLAKTRELTMGKACLWGGVNGHLTLEQGSPEQVRQETLVALEILSPGSGFILSPVDNVRVDNTQVRQNVLALIQAWKSTYG